MEIIPARGPILHLSIAMIILTGIAVFTRSIIRVHSKAPFAADDWWLFLSIFCFYTYQGILIWCKSRPGALLIKLTVQTQAW